MIVSLTAGIVSVVPWLLSINSYSKWKRGRISEPKFATYWGLALSMLLGFSLVASAGGLLLVRSESPEARGPSARVEPVASPREQAHTSDSASGLYPLSFCKAMIRKHPNPYASLLGLGIHAILLKSSAPNELDVRPLMHQSTNWMATATKMDTCIADYGALPGGDATLMTTSVPLGVMGESIDNAIAAQWASSAEEGMYTLVQAYPDSCYSSIAQSYLDAGKLPTNTLDNRLKACSP